MAAKTSLKITKSLYERAQQQSEAAGYSSVEEFVEHVLERELARGEESASRDEVEQKLKGLGYLE